MDHRRFHGVIPGGITGKFREFKKDLVQFLEVFFAQIIE